MCYNSVMVYDYYSWCEVIIIIIIKVLLLKQDLDDCSVGDAGAGTCNNRNGHWYVVVLTAMLQHRIGP